MYTSSSPRSRRLGGPCRLTQSLHRAAIELAHGLRRTLETDARELPSRYHHVTKERGARASELAEDAHRGAVIVCLGVHGQPVTLQPRGVRSQKRTRQVAWFGNRPTRRALLAQEAEELTQAAELSRAR